MSEIRCPVCSVPLRISPAKSRKAKKPKTFVMLACPEDGRHFRGFIADRRFVSGVLAAAERAVETPEPDSVGYG